MLEIKVLKQKIETLTQEDHTRGTIGAQVKITFDDFWAGYEKKVVFKCCYNSLNDPVPVLVSGMSVVVEIPPEILAESGKYKIGVIGIKDGIVLPTLYSEEFNSLYATDTKGLKSADEYTPSEIDQLRLLKQDKLTAGENITIDENNVISAAGGGSGTTDYELLDNKPKINGVEINGEMTADDLSLVDKKTFDNAIGYIEGALDEIIALQEQYIGGDSE